MHVDILLSRKNHKLTSVDVPLRLEQTESYFHLKADKGMHFHLGSLIHKK